MEGMVIRQWKRILRPIHSLRRMPRKGACLETAQAAPNHCIQSARSRARLMHVVSAVFDFVAYGNPCTSRLSEGSKASSQSPLEHRFAILRGFGNATGLVASEN